MNKFEGLDSKTIKHNHEACETILKSIIFVLKDEFIDMTFNEFVKIIYKTCFKIDIDNINVSSHYLTFYCYLEKPKKFENKIIINLPFDYSNNEIVYRLNNLLDDKYFENIYLLNKYFENIYLLNDCILCNDKIRRERYYSKDTISYFIQRIYSQYETISFGDLQIRNHFELDNYNIKGFFFECNLEYLNSVKICISQQPIVNYDKLLLQIQGWKLKVLDYFIQKFKIYC